MIKYLTSRYSNIIVLLVGVCLVGSAFHVHQLHPDYILQDGHIPQHISVDQPDCVACMNLVQATFSLYESCNRIPHGSEIISLMPDQLTPVESISDLNNKSPPF